MKTIRKKTEEPRLSTHQIKVWYIFLIVLVQGFISFEADAQHKITLVDEQNFKRMSLDLVTGLERFYNLLLEASSAERKTAIDNQTLPKDGSYTLFMDDQVQIEDDFQTEENNSTEKSTMSVNLYLTSICQHYGKSDNGEYENDREEVSFKNITITKIMARSDKDPMFVKVNFLIEYSGKDKRTKLPFKPSNRVAEIQLKKAGERYYATIAAIRFLRDDEKDYSGNVLISRADTDQNTDFIKSLVEEDAKVVFVKNKTMLRAFKNSEKWGIKNGQNKLVELPIFDSIYEFSDNGLALVNINGLWGYIDVTGKRVIKCEYDEAEPFSNGKKAKALVTKGRETFYIDSQGKRVK